VLDEELLTLLELLDEDFEVDVLVDVEVVDLLVVVMLLVDELLLLDVDSSTHERILTSPDLNTRCPVLNRK
jgi:hypothetical protein